MGNVTFFAIIDHNSQICIFLRDHEHNHFYIHWPDFEAGNFPPALLRSAPLGGAVVFEGRYETVDDEQWWSGTWRLATDEEILDVLRHPNNKEPNAISKI